MIGLIHEVLEIDGFQVNGLIEKDPSGILGVIGVRSRLLHAVKHAVEVVRAVDGGRDAIDGDDGGAHMVVGAG